MCGLTGIFCSIPRNDIIGQLSKMTSSLIHRGPNDEGVWHENYIGFGHRRLSILDLSNSGKQPMKSNCERFIMAYNGEIYNHLELRHELEKIDKAPKWQGHSDTETLIATIKHWGIDGALRRAHGMFALAVWDKANKSLSLARDRIGEKPLYWGWAGSDLIFGSELKALRSHTNFLNKLCKKALSQYLRFMYVPAPRSIYQDIYKLEPGTILTVNVTPPSNPPKNPIRPGESHGSLSIRRYWNLKEKHETESLNMIEDDNEAVSMIDKTLKKVVNKQMISDVPLGAFLSGGVDSSSVVALMQAQVNRPVKTFTIGFSEKKYDESIHAEAVSKHLGTDHTKLHVSDSDARNIIPNLPLIYDEPFADSSQIPTYLVCHAARQKVTVALSGDGGDELFGGYNRYIYGPKMLKQISSLPLSIRKFSGSMMQNIPENFWDRIEHFYNKIRTGSKGISNMGNKIQRLADHLLMTSNVNELYYNIVSNWHEPEKLLMNIVNEPVSQLEDELPKYGINNPAKRMMFQDMRTYLPDDILCKVDRAAMRINLETRIPFLDPDMIELSMRLPSHMKIRNGHGKWALRQVLYKYVPREIIDRPKVGFSIPIGLWLRGPLRSWAEDLLSSEKLANDGLFNYEIIMKKWTEHLSGRRDWTNQLWAILMFQAWKQYWLK